MLYKNVFSPIKIGGVEIKNRIATPPMLSCMADSAGMVTREMIEFYGAFARGGAGIVNIGDSAVDYEYGKGHHSQLNLGDDRVIGGLSNLVEYIEKFGAKCSVEINHPGRMASSVVLNGKAPIAPSAIPTAWDEMAIKAFGKYVQITVMDQKMIDHVIENYAAAAYRCLTAGFRMIMIHGAHGNLLAQFVSPLTNKRTDKYGGNLQNRARFVIELLTAIRKRVGNQLAIEYRVSGSELAPGGMHEEETIEFIKLIEDKIDLVHVSLGMVSDPHYIYHMAQPTYLPHDYNVHRAEMIKKAIKIPVTCVGSIYNLESAENIIAEGKADIVAMGRPHIADPEIIIKSRRGEAVDVRPCIRCQYCGERPANFFPVRCTVNPVAGREIEYKNIRPADKKKKVVIVGGGPAGMEAAIIASSRGHKVTLFEKEKELGGALRYAAAPSFKNDMKRFLEWLIKKTNQANIEIKLATEATIEEISAINPDVLILAAGADPLIPDIPGINGPDVVWAGDIDIGNAVAGQNVVVAGGGLTGCETALHLAMQGKNVTIIEMLNDIAQDSSVAGKYALVDMLAEHKVEIRTGVRLVAITEKAAVISDKEGKQTELTADTVVLALGINPRSDTVNNLRNIVTEVSVVGDCSGHRNLMAAIHDGFNVAAEI